MKIRLNGKDILFKGESLIELIKKYNLAEKGIVVEQNGEIVHRDGYSTAMIAEGDVIEIVHVVGGG